MAKSDLLLAVTQLAVERNLPHAVVVSAIEAALASAYKRDPAAGGQDVIVAIDPEDGDVTVSTVRHVVESDDIEDEFAQVSVEAAQDLQKGAQAGDYIVTGELEYNPGRIAAQTAKQVVMQRLREAERDLVFDEFVDRAGEVLTATIQRVDSRQIIVDLGRAEAILPPAEQSQFERYRPGQQLKFYVLRVERTVRGPEIVVSRTHPDLLRRLFEVEVPEIYNGVIEIKAIAREAGSRSKVAVVSHQAGVDAVGACVGLRGIRIQNVVNELLGEKIDVIEWDEDPKRFIANSLSPSSVDRVILSDDGETAVVLVPDRQLSLAIGREGQNARLAAKLTTRKIDIQGETQWAAAQAPPEPVAQAVATAAQPSAAVAAETVLAQTAVATAPPEAKGAAAPVATPAPVVAKPKPVVPVVDEEAELLKLEAELAELERQEQERKEAAREATIDVSSGDLWQVGGKGSSETEEAGVLRFSEDIAGFREQGEGRRRRTGGGGGGGGGGARRKGGRR
ncbi:MAG: transcription termination factor NusA [Chloroflexi bacterium]|nr:transcription termination factor NusA [Chloroflexota bacterium]